MSEFDVAGIKTILNTIDALVRVSDMETDEVIFMNRRGKQYWNRSWRGAQYRHVREFRSEDTGRWFECRDHAIPWIDGRTVRLELAFDITERKTVEVDLRQSLQAAETLARIDVLTRLKNRRAFFEEAERIFAEPPRGCATHCVAMLDVDEFKLINDQYGHPVGDSVLREIGRLIAQGLRSIDVGGRLGGEEFALIFPNTSILSATMACEAIRRSIGAINPDVNGRALKVSCSFGLAAQDCGAATVDDALIAADKALYEAKKLGRNRLGVAAAGRAHSQQ